MAEKFKAKCKEIWDSCGTAFLVGLPIAAIAIFVAVSYASTVMPSPFEQPVLPSDNIAASSQVEQAVQEEASIPVKTEPDIEKMDFEQVTQQIWEAQEVSLSTEEYTLPQDAALANGSIGTLSIPKISLTAPVYEAEDGEEIEAMTKGVAHFAVTSSWTGNVGLCSHNVAPNGAVAYFRALHLLEKGDELTYKTALGDRTYKVTQIKEIAEDDWGYLMRYDDDLNRITMITCITGKPNMRLMVQATEL